ncbi:unnamed protein product [Cunninghamella blakesleeana]
MMSVSSFSNFTILIKKIARKSSLRKRFSTTKKQQRSQLHKTTATLQEEEQDIGSISTCSSNEDDHHKSVVVVMKNVPVTTQKNEKQDVLNNNNNNSNNNDNNNDHDHDHPSPLSLKKSLSSIHSAKTTTTDIKKKTDEEETIIINEIENNNDIEDDQQSTIKEKDEEDKEDDIRIPTIQVRDYGYSTSSSLHHGFIEPSIIYDQQNASSISLSSERFNGRQAKALYDFIPETDYEIAMNVGQTVWIQYRQCDGWLMAEIENETGLVPESYIEFI